MALIIGAASLLSGTLGGAVGAIAGKKNRKPADKVHAELIERGKELEKKIKTLEVSMKDEAADNKQLQVQMQALEDEKKALVQEKEEFEAREKELEAHKQTMDMQQMLLIKDNEALKEQAEQLEREKNDLLKQLHLEQKRHQEEMSRHSAELESLKESVTGVVRRLLASDLSDEEAVKELESLGCQVQFIEDGSASGTAPTADMKAIKANLEVWSMDSHLILEDRSRLEKFVTSCMRSKAITVSEGGGGAPAVPILRLPSAATRIDLNQAQSFSTSRAVDALHSTMRRLTEGGMHVDTKQPNERDQSSKEVAPPPVMDAAKQVAASEAKKTILSTPNLNGRKVLFTLPAVGRDAKQKGSKGTMAAIDSAGLASMMGSDKGLDDDFPLGLGSTLAVRR